MPLAVLRAGVVVTFCASRRRGARRLTVAARRWPGDVLSRGDCSFDRAGIYNPASSTLDSWSAGPPKARLKSRTYSMERWDAKPSRSGNREYRCTPKRRRERVASRQVRSPKSRSTADYLIVPIARGFGMGRKEPAEDRGSLAPEFRRWPSLRAPRAWRLRALWSD